MITVLLEESILYCVCQSFPIIVNTDFPEMTIRTHSPVRAISENNIL